MDGLAIKRLAEDWQANLVGARIERIHQPENRTLVLTLRTIAGTKRILLSAHRTFARAHALVQGKPENPLQPPLFCMVLRKRLETGRIVRIEQPGYERILRIWIEARDELGDLVRYALIAELMGKHSNIVLCAEDEASLKIIDSIMHVGRDLSRVRQVLPGLSYVDPPARAGHIPDTIPDQALQEIAVMDAKAGIRELTRLVFGIGPVTAKEIWDRASREPGGLSLTALRTVIQRILQITRHHEETPSIGLSDVGKPMACAPFNLSAWPGQLHLEPFDEALERFYADFAAEASESQRQHDLRQKLEDVLSRLRGKHAKLCKEFEQGQGHEEDRIKGEILTAYAWQVEKGQTEVMLPNFYEHDALIRIPLDPAKTPIENAQAWFKRASKRKRAASLLASAIEETSGDIHYLEQCLYLLQYNDAAALSDLQDELIAEGFLKPSRKQRGKSAVKTPRQGADVYQSSDGWTIRVGHNNLQNDRLTFRQSKADDLWLHVKDAPGSHVVIERKKPTVPDDTVAEAAVLAAYFSKGRDSANVPVDMTEIKHVWKPNGARPGFALYKGQKTLYVTPDRQWVQTIQSRTMTDSASKGSGQPSNSSSRRSR